MSKVDTTRTFGHELRAAREKNSWPVHNMARNSGVTEAVWRQWEADEVIPTARQFNKITGSLRSMRVWRDWVRQQNNKPKPIVLTEQRVLAHPTTPPPLPARTVAETEPAPRPVVVVSNIPMAVTAATVPGVKEALASPAHGIKPPVHGTFGEVLKAERTAANLSQEELGRMLDVTGNAVTRWEHDEFAPVKENLDKLMSLFPALAKAPAPGSQDIPKPIGQTENKAQPAGRPSGKPAPAPAPPPEADVTIDGLSFGAALAKVRLASGLERLDLAQKIGVSRRVVQGWELGERLPIPEHIDAIMGIFPSLAPFEFQPSARTGSDGAPTFGDALRLEREHAGMHRTDLAKLIGMSHWTVQVWEYDRYPPKPIMYARLCEIFPDLAKGPKPPVIPGETAPMPVAAVPTIAAPVVATTPPAAPSGPSGIGGFIKLMAAARKVEASGSADAVRHLLREGQATGATVADLLLLLDGGA